MENLKYRVIYVYEYHRGTCTAETAQRVNEIYCGGVAKENTVRFLFQRFLYGNFDPRGQPESKVENEGLKAIVETDPSQTTRIHSRRWQFDMRQRLQASKSCTKTTGSVYSMQQIVLDDYHAKTSRSKAEDVVCECS
ncbi:jg3322 [Pararge aegeria aegeria]|uniref:Jg3322 protein n=1 Tax=Pararge aegeria aegeria TaxID=348720 RepID=A0A8S4RS77_9NEOP|nr:jg3322 [Pararge aegeria aegeria]